MKKTLLTPIIIISAVILILITLFTFYYGSTDVGDYSDSAKYTAGDYSAKIRVSHSFLYGVIHSPFVSLFKSFLIFKITSLIFLIMIIMSVYIISNKDKKAFLLAFFSPIIWYMAPWINPIQLTSLFLLWAYYFMEEYNRKNKLNLLALSGILMGLCICFWNTAIYITVLIIIVFLFDKKFSHAIMFSTSVLIGTIPLLFTDYLLFNFPFYTLIKTTFSQLLFVVFKESLYTASPSNRILDIIFVLLFLPFYFWIIYKPSFFKENKKSVIFITLSLLVILSNPQIRYVLVISPTILLLLSKTLTLKQVKRYLIFSIILLLILLIPYLIQIRYNINSSLPGMEIKEFVSQRNNLTFSKNFSSDLLSQDLISLSKDFPNQTFLVGNLPDDYQTLADLYWGKDVNEFVSIQDYELYNKNTTVLLQKKIISVPKIRDRRQIWIAGGISKNENDNTNYKNITLALSIGEPINLENFKLVKKYNLIYLSKKI